MSTDIELRDQAVAELKLTTVGFVNKKWTPPPPAGTHWANALGLLAQIGAAPPPPPPAGVTMADLKGVCLYDLLAVQKAVSVYGATMARSDFYVCTDAYMSGCKTAGVEVLPIACFSQGLSSKGDHYYPDDFNVWASKQAAFVAKWGCRAIEVWNEPWLLPFSKDGVDPARYFQLVKATAQAVWARAPQTLIVFSLDYFTQSDPQGQRNWQNLVLQADTSGFLNDPRIRPSTHNYCQTATPEDPRSTGWAFDRYRLAYDALKAHGHPNPMVWVTEYGWDTFGGPETAPVTEAQQADYTVRGLKLMLASGKVERAFVFKGGADDWYGLFRPDGTPRPVCAAVRAL